MFGVRQAVEILVGVVMLFHCRSEIDRGKQRENVRLDECDEQFQEHHENAEGNRSNRNTETGAG